MPQPAEEDPLAAATRAPLAHRLGGAALFILAAILGISTLRACRNESSPPATIPGAVDSPSARP